MTADARLYDWRGAKSAANSPGADTRPDESSESIAAAVLEIREAAEQIQAEGITVEDARARAARVVELCNQLEQGSAAARRATRTLADRRRADRRSGTHEDSASPTDSQSPPHDTLADPRLRALSKRELEVFRFLAEGKSAGEIASRLSRSAKTIHNHRTRILQKLGLKNATELVRLAMRCGIVSI